MYINVLATRLQTMRLMNKRAQAAGITAVTHV